MSTPRDGRPWRPIGERGRAWRPGGTPVSAAAPVPLRLLREPLLARAPAGGAGGEPWRWGGAATRGARPGLEHLACATETGRCDSRLGERRGPRWPGEPLSASAWPPAPPPPRADLTLSGPGPRPALLPAPPRAACSQPCLPSPGQGCTRSWAAEAGAKARGCFFTRSLKYFGKPQSEAARKWPLACSRQAVAGERGLGLERKSFLSNF